MLTIWLPLGLFISAALTLGTALILMSRQPKADAPELQPAPRASELHLASSEDSDQASALRRQLFQAGFEHPLAVKLYVYAKLAAAAIGFLFALAALRFFPLLAQLPASSRIGCLLLVPIAGYFLPVSFVERRRRAWLEKIGLALPDALDFMLICVEAGQSADVAIKRVAEELAPVHPELAARFVSLTEALAAGADRHEAWLKLAQTTANDDLRQLAGIILQSTHLGTPIAQTLRVFAADLRDQRIRRIEERANVLSTKMTLGTMVFTVPPLLILLLAPAIHRIATSI